MTFLHHILSLCIVLLFSLLSSAAFASTPRASTYEQDQTRDLGNAEYLEEYGDVFDAVQAEFKSGLAIDRLAMEAGVQRGVNFTEQNLNALGLGAGAGAALATSVMLAPEVIAAMVASGELVSTGTAGVYVACATSGACTTVVSAAVKLGTVAGVALTAHCVGEHVGGDPSCVGMLASGPGGSLQLVTAEAVAALNVIKATSQAIRNGRVVPYTAERIREAYVTLRASEAEATNRTGRGVTATGRPIEFDGQNYRADGFSFSDRYYNYLYDNSRLDPYLQAHEVLNSNPVVTPDPQGAAGFFRYEGGGLEMIYNPTTGQVVHLQSIR